MGILDTLKRTFSVSTSSRYPRVVLAPMATDAVGASGSFEVSKPADFVSIENYYEFMLTYPSLPYVYAAIHKIASSGSIVPIEVVERTPVTELQDDGVLDVPVKKYGKTVLRKQEAGGYDEVSSLAEVNQRELVVVEHPLLSLLKYPNPRQTTTLLMYSTYAFLELTGNAFWLLTRDKNGEVDGIYIPRPDQVKVLSSSRPGSPNRVSYQRSSVSGETSMWDQEDVVHFRYFNPLSDTVGMGPLSPARQSIILDLYCSSYNKSFFRNSARPDVLLVLPAETRLDESTFNRIREQWNIMHSGSEKSHKTAVLEGGLDVKVLTNNRKDMEFNEQMNRNRLDILSTLGVDSALLGIRNNSMAKDEYREIERYFWESTMLPTMISVAETMETFLFPKVHPIPINVFQGMYRMMMEESKGISEQSARFNLRRQDNPLTNALGMFSVRYNTSKVRALQEAANDRSQIHVRYVSTGIMTPNDVRRELDLPPVSWGDRPPPNAAYGLAVSRGDVNEMRTAIEPQHVATPSEMADLQDQVSQNADSWSKE